MIRAGSRITPYHPSMDEISREWSTPTLTALTVTYDTAEPSSSSDQLLGG